MPRAGRARQARALETRDGRRGKWGESGGLRRVLPGMSERSPGRTGIAEVSVRKVAPLPVQSVIAARVFSPDPGPPASLWDWLARLPDPRDRRGVRFTLACVIAVAIAARLAGCDSFTAVGEWAASRPQRVLKALGCPLSKRAGSMSPRRRRRCGGSPARLAWTMTWLMTCCAGGQPGWPPRARSSPRRSCRNSAAARPARPGRRRGKRRRRPARPPGGTGRPAPRRRRRPARPASRHGKPPRPRAAASAQAVAGGRAKLPGRLGLRARPGPRGAPGAPRWRLRRPPPRPRAARPGCPTARHPAAPRSKARRRPSTWGSSGIAPG